jgi:hypothetical protein
MSTDVPPNLQDDVGQFVTFMHSSRAVLWAPREWLSTYSRRAGGGCVSLVLQRTVYRDTAELSQAESASVLREEVPAQLGPVERGNPHPVIGTSSFYRAQIPHLRTEQISVAKSFLPFRNLWHEQSTVRQEYRIERIVGLLRLYGGATSRSPTGKEKVVPVLN